MRDDRRRARIRALAGSALLVALLAGCSTATPVVLQGARIPNLTGRVNTTAGYTGEITTENRQCRGSFTGMLGQGTVPLEVSCIDGRSGIGTAQILDGRFAGAEARLSDGTRLTIRVDGQGFP